MDKLLLVACGGAGGSVARWLLAEWANARFPGRIVWGTFAVNLIGSFLLGVVMQLAGGAAPVVSPNARLLLGVGVLGGFTTYSTFSHDAWRLIETGEWGAAALYVGATVALCLLAVGAGAKLASAAG